MRPIGLLLVFALLAVGCGGGGGDAAEDSGMEEGGEEMAEAMDSTPMGSGSITGMISFDGAAPERMPLRMTADCMDERDTDPLSDATVVGESGGLQSVFVYVSAGLPDGYSYAAPSEPAVLDQEGCMYVPHVMGVQTGQMIRIENSDPFQHNIHPVPETNRGFNESTPNEGDYLEKSFLVPEVMISVKCDVHTWMQAYIGVLDHPYFGVSDADGSFSISGLPAGDYTVTAWHSQLGEQTMSVSVADGETAVADVSYSAAS